MYGQRRPDREHHHVQRSDTPVAVEVKETPVQVAVRFGHLLES